MSTCKFNIATGGAVGSIGMWFKIPANPASQTALLEIFQTGSGYFRFSLTSAGLVVAEWNGFSSGSTNLTSALTLNTWCFVRCWSHYDGDNRSRFSADATYFGGTAAGSFTSGALFTGAPAIQWPTAVFAVGTSPSNGSYAAFPTTAGWEFSKPICNGSYAANANGPILVPGADWGSSGQAMVISSGFGGYYNMRAGRVSSTVISDDSGNGFDLTGTFVGYTDGPYGS